MASKRSGEKYFGHELHVPLSADGQVTAYVWPIRALNVRGSWCGGPTIGVEVGNEEVLRFDCHDRPGHWHGGGYDRSGSPGNSHRDFPEGIVAVADQVEWSLQTLTERTSELLAEAEHADAAGSLEQDMVQAAVANIRAHLEQQGDLRGKAIADGTIDS
jgi:hypothetical protein